MLPESLKNHLMWVLVLVYIFLAKIGVVLVVLVILTLHVFSSLIGRFKGALTSTKPQI